MNPVQPYPTNISKRAGSEQIKIVLLTKKTFREILMSFRYMLKKRFISPRHDKISAEHWLRFLAPAVSKYVQSFSMAHVTLVIIFLGVVLSVQSFIDHSHFKHLI